MAQQNILKSDFSRGALTPLAHARQEKEWYAACLQSIENFTVLKYGGIRRRPGTRYCGTLKEHDKYGNHIPFTFSTTQVYFLEFGDLQFRVRDADGNLILSGGTPLEVTTPYTSDDLADIQYEQFGDTIFLAHPSYPPGRIQRISNDNWTYAEVDFLDGPYLPINDTAVTISASIAPTAGSSPTLTFSNVSAINDGAGFASADVGRHVRFQMGGNYAWGVITSVTNSTTVVASIKESEIGANSASSTWRLGIQGGSQGYFACVSFYQGRLCWARTTGQPRTIALSQSGLPYRYSPSALSGGTVTDDHGFTVAVLSGRADEILWLRENVSLQFGTASAIRSLGPQDNSTAFGPRNFRERLEIGSGSAPVVPILAGSSIVHVGRFGVTLRDLFYDFQVDGLVSPELSTLSQHLLTAGVIQLAYCQEPNSTIWALLENGELVGMTYERFDKVIGLHRHLTANGFIESIAAAPNYTGKYDALIMTVRREIAEETVRYVEMLESEFVNKEQEDAWFVDCGIRYEGDPVNVLTGLDHLKLEEVAIFANGAVLPRQEVSLDGKLTLPNGLLATKVLVGLPMTSRAKFLRLNVLLREGSQFGLEKRVPYVVVDVFETSDLKIGNGTSYEPLHKRMPSDPMGSSPRLFTGIKRLSVETDWKMDDGQLELLCESVFPATIRAVNFGVQV